MSKIAEIREKIEACFDPEEKEIALNLCDALIYTREIIKVIPPKHYAEEQLAKIDQILEGKNG